MRGTSTSSAHPAGTSGFDDLADTAATLRLAGVDVLVADLDDLIAMKRAAGRAKDRVELEILAAVREERRRREPEGR